jgi:serine/threonine protein kinase
MQSDEPTQLNETPVKAKPRDPLVGTTLDGRFRIEELVGSGGMSNVYRAVQLRVNRDVAIKTLKVQVDDQPIYRERFQREVDLLCALSHPNIVTVYDCLLGPDGQPCVVMDYLRGRSLEQLLEDEGAINVARFARIFVQVLGALDHAHRKGVVHRDIKPGNIVMLDRETDLVKVVDFGLAKFNQESRRLTHTGELWGSPPYMSPEQCMGKPDSERSDIYSVGVVMYEMLTGKDPFHHATSIYELIQCHVNVPPPPMAQLNAFINLPPGLEDVLLKAMAKDPADRYQSANELKDALVATCLKADDAIISSGATRANSDSPWINGAPGTTSGAQSNSIGDFQSGDSLGSRGTGLDSGGVSPQRIPSAELSPWSREGASRAAARGSNAESNPGTASGAAPDFGSGQQLAECGDCGKPIQRQRRGSMTSWILADHHKVMEKISGVCNCTSESLSGEQPRPISRQGDVGNTGMQIANLLARQGMPQGMDERTSVSGQTGGNISGAAGIGASGSTGGSAPRHERLFEDTSKAAGKSAMRQNADRLASNSFVGNQIITVIFALVVVAGIVFGSIQFLATMKQNKDAASISAPAAPEKTEAADTTRTSEEDDGVKPTAPTKAAEGRKATVRTNQPRSPRSAGRTSAPKRINTPKQSSKPAMKPVAKPGNAWDALQDYRKGGK